MLFRFVITCCDGPRELVDRSLGRMLIPIRCPRCEQPVLPMVRGILSKAEEAAMRDAR